MRRLARLWPLLLLLAVLAAAWALGVRSYLSWAALAREQSALHALVAAHPWRSAAAYVALYAVAVGVSLPGGVVLTVAGGLLFGAALGAALAVLGASLGAVLLFLAARHALAGFLAARAAPLLARIGPGLQRDGFSYLLALRLLPVFPFWLVNLAPALLGMRLAPYAAATALGVIPATVVFAGLGAGVGGVLAAGGRPNVSLILAPHVLLPLLGLAALSLAPVLWRRGRRG